MTKCVALFEGLKGLCEGGNHELFCLSPRLVVVARKRARNGTMDSWRPSAVEAHPVDSWSVNWASYNTLDLGHSERAN